MTVNSSLSQPAVPASQLDPLDARPVIDLRRLFGMVWQYRWIVLGITLACAALGLIVSLLMVPQYTASASLQIDQEEQRILESQEAANASSKQDADRFLQTAVDVLRSRRMALRAAEEMNLFADDSFLDLMNVDPPATDELQPERVRRELVLRTIGENLSISLPTDSRVVTVQFTSPDREFSARFVNTFVGNFLRYNIERKLERTVYARDFLSKQLADARQKLERAEREANAYARSTGLVRLPSTTPGAEDITITTVNLGDYNSALTQARTARIAAEGKWNRVAQAPVLGIAEVVNNKAIQDLIAARAIVDAKLQSELATKQAGHPTVAPLVQQKAEYDQQISTLASGIRNAIRDEYRIAAQREAELQQRVSSLSGATQQERETGVQLKTLNREVDTSRQLYDSLLQRFQELSAEANITSNNVQQIDIAEPPVRPSSPRVLLNIALGLLAGLALSALFVFLREQMDDRIHVPGNVEDKLGLKLLGVTPQVGPGASPIDTLDDPKAPLTESFHSIRTALQFATETGAPRRLVVTSARASEGKSSTSYGIARTFAESGRKALLIDCDLRKPSLHRVTGLTDRTGLVDVLGSDKSLDRAIQPSGIPNLDVILSGAIPANPTDILASPQFIAALDALDERYDLLVLDSPPVLGLADAIILSALPGVSTLFAIEAGRSHRGAAKGAIRRLQDGGSQIIGAILTQFDFEAARRRGFAGGDSFAQYYGYYEYGR